LLNLLLKLLNRGGNFGLLCHGWLRTTTVRGDIILGLTESEFIGLSLPLLLGLLSLLGILPLLLGRNLLNIILLHSVGLLLHTVCVYLGHSRQPTAIYLWLFQPNMKQRLSVAMKVAVLVLQRLLDFTVELDDVGLVDVHEMLTPSASTLPVALPPAVSSEARSCLVAGSVGRSAADATP
jgi:hypothetical protein